MTFKVLKGKGERAAVTEYVSLPISASLGSLLDRVVKTAPLVKGVPMTRSQAVLALLDMIQDSNRAPSPGGR